MGRGEKGGREEKGRGAYQDDGPLTKILNTPLRREGEEGQGLPMLSKMCLYYTFTACTVDSLFGHGPSHSTQMLLSLV